MGDRRVGGDDQIEIFHHRSGIDEPIRSAVEIAQSLHVDIRWQARELIQAGMMGLKRKRFVIARQRLIEPVQALGRNAAVRDGLSKIGLERNRLRLANASSRRFSS